jgi:putative NIF3 family GTP cyclohydrolase 1 type 2
MTYSKPDTERSLTSLSFTNKTAANSSPSMQIQKKPTHAAVGRFIASLLPVKENDVSRLYHVPRNTLYNPDTAVVEQIVLSITPTPGVYSLIGYPINETNIDPRAPLPITSARPPRTVAFLHRPFTLDRRSVRRGTLIFASHTSFDENLTVGWNPALAERLGMSARESLCVQGYKGDPERKIGIIGQVAASQKALLEQIQSEFGEIEMVQAGLSDEIRVVAIMNAFNDEEVHRVLGMVQEQGWVPDEDSEAQGRHVLYLTGQPRASGLQAAAALGLTVACVGHKTAEEWGIRFLAAGLRMAFPSMHVEEVHEDEIPVIRPKKEAVPIPTADPVVL